MSTNPEPVEGSILRRKLAGMSPETQAEFDKLQKLFERSPHDGRWYHASRADLAPGTVLVPGGVGDVPSAKFYESDNPDRRNWVWVSPDRAEATFWGFVQKAPFIYEVEPIGEVKAWGTGVDGYICKSAKVLVQVSKTGALQAKLARALPPLTFDVETWRHPMPAGGSVWATEADGKLAGSINWNYVEEYGYAIIQDVVVADDLRRNGLATELLARARAAVPYEIHHSEMLSEDGEQWAAKVASGSAPRLFHGTPNALPIGTILVGGGPDGTLVNGGANRGRWVWLTASPAEALDWASTGGMNDDGTWTSNAGHAYEVDASEAVQIKDIPDGSNKPIGYEGAWVAPSARIIAEVGPRGGRKTAAEVGVHNWLSKPVTPMQDLRHVVSIPPDSEWENLPVETLKIEDLTPTQDLVKDDNDGKLSDDPIKVLEAGGELYIIDGHHRATKAQHQGRTTIKAYVLHHAKTASLDVDGMEILIDAITNKTPVSVLYRNKPGYAMTVKGVPVGGGPGVLNLSDWPARDILWDDIVSIEPVMEKAAEWKPSEHPRNADGTFSEVDGETLDEIWENIGGTELDRKGHEVHPERYVKNKVSGYSLKKGERETRVRGTDHGDEFYDVETLPDGENTDTYREKGRKMVGMGGEGMRPIYEVPGTARPVTTGYRMVDDEEWEQAKKDGYFKSDGRMNLDSGEGTVISTRSTGGFYAPPVGRKARVVRFKLDPADKWRTDPADSYMKSNEKIPFDRVEAVSVPMEVKPGYKGIGHELHPVRKKSALTAKLVSTAWADFPVDEGHVSRHEFDMSRAQGDWGFYSREQDLVDAGMPNGQQFPTPEDIARYIRPLLPGLEIEVFFINDVGSAYSGLSTDGQGARFLFGQNMNYEIRVLHEVAHIRNRLKNGRGGASHGGAFATEFADLLWSEMGIGIGLRNKASAEDWRSGLTTEERALLDQWQLDRKPADYKRLKSGRGPLYRAFRELLDSAPKFTGTVYRGQETPDPVMGIKFMADLEEHWRSKVGSTIDIKSGLSTSTDKVVAAGFAHTVWEIEVSNMPEIGSKMNEVVLLPGTLTVTGFRYEESASRSFMFTVTEGEPKRIGVVEMRYEPESMTASGALVSKLLSTAGWDDPETQRKLEELAEILTTPTGKPYDPIGDLPDPNAGYGGYISQDRNGHLILDGQPVTKLYRVVDPAEWAAAQAQGALQSHEGYTRASAAADDRWRYQGAPGVRGLTLEITYDPADRWHASAEGYAATHQPIPLSRVRKVGAKTAAGERINARDWERGDRVIIARYPDEPGTVAKIQGQGIPYSKVFLTISFDSDPDRHAQYDAKECRRIAKTAATKWINTGPEDMTPLDASKLTYKTTIADRVGNIEALDPQGKRQAILIWGDEDGDGRGIIHLVHVEERYRRQGVASMLLQKARAAVDYTIEHSDDLSEDGRAWSQVTAGSSWRPMTTEQPWLDHDVVIFSDGGPSGRKSYEVYVGGRLIATRNSLAEAMEAAGSGLDWSTKRLDPMEVEHYAFGPTTQFGTPTTIWTAKTAGLGQRYYHGTNADLPIGTVLIPEGPTGRSEYGSQPGVWMTTNPDLAANFGEHVYLVEPSGLVGNLGNPETFYVPSARIVSQVSAGAVLAHGVLMAKLLATG